MHVNNLELASSILKVSSGGYQPETESIISFSGFCGEGYQGVACKNCIPGYAKFGGKKKSAT